MWTRVNLNVQIVWEDVLYHVHALWQENDEDEPVVLTKDGRVPLPPDGGPDEALLAAVRAIQARPYEPHPGGAPASRVYSARRRTDPST